MANVGVRFCRDFGGKMLRAHVASAQRGENGGEFCNWSCAGVLKVL